MIDWSNSLETPVETEPLRGEKNGERCLSGADLKFEEPVLTISPQKSLEGKELAATH